MPSDPSEGVFFVFRLPDSWQLCTCRHDEYGPMGLPDFWVEALGPYLNIWLRHFKATDPEHASKRHADLERSLGQIVAGYDAFPRGEIKRRDGRRRYIVRHGGDVTRAMHVRRRDIEEAFGIRGRASWVADAHHHSVADSAQRLRELLPIEEHWEKPRAKRVRASS